MRSIEDRWVTTLAVFHTKGGVGKTATAVNLSYLAAKSGAHTLICDLDPQGSATYYFRVKPKVKASRKVFIKGGRHISRNIKGTDYDDLDLLPADLSHRHLATTLDKVKHARQRLHDVLAPLQKEYAHIVLDCPPTLSLVADNIVNAANWLLVPVIPTTLSLYTYRQLLTFLREHDYDDSKLIAFFSMVEANKTMHRTTMQDTLAHDAHFLTSTIPYNADIEKMGLRREPVVAFAPRSRAAQAYRQLWTEIQERFTGR
jgi:cellulose biosynthesis protein BcsQ